MKKLSFGFSTAIILGMLFTACQSSENEEVHTNSAHNDTNNNHEQNEEIRENNHDHAHDHEHDDHSHEGKEEAPEDVTIEGVAHHYHTGDAIELSAVLDEEISYDHWHWYSRENHEEDWEVISGQGTASLTDEATIDGLEIKAVLFDDDHQPHVQSAPVTIVIDDHHGHDEESQAIYQGYFEDEQIEDRELSDWEGDWQSVYPYLLDGDLDDVFEDKAAHGEMTAEEYRDYYTIGYETNVDRIVIEEDTFTFYEDGNELSGGYVYDGYEILTYERGNRGVRFIFEKDNGDENMPEYIQFSDRNIFPVEAHHFHLYWGDDRAELLEEVTNWPTYYPSHLDADGLVRDMLAH